MLQHDRALRELVAVGASPSARAVVLWRAVPAGSGTSRRRNGVDGGERERESQSDLGHGRSPRVEARSGFCGLDRGTRRLFLPSHSNGVCLVQVFVCSVRCAVHIGVSCRCNRTSGHIRLAVFQIFDVSSARQDCGELCGVSTSITAS
jgi:hypothetical protein